MFTFVIQIYQQRLNSKPYVPYTTFGHTTLGADGVANKLFIVHLSSYSMDCQFFIFGYFLKICRENSSFIKIW